MPEYGYYLFQFHISLSHRFHGDRTNTTQIQISTMPLIWSSNLYIARLNLAMQVKILIFFPQIHGLLSLFIDHLNCLHVGDVFTVSTNTLPWYLSFTSLPQDHQTLSKSLWSPWSCSYLALLLRVEIRYHHNRMHAFHNND